MEGQSKWRGRDPAEEKSSSDKVRRCCFLTRSARSVITLCALPGGEREGRRGVDVGEREGRGRGEGGVEGKEEGRARYLRL